MSKKTYEDPLPRDVRQIDPPEPQKHVASKKGRAKWCGKKVGREHIPEMRVDTGYWNPGKCEVRWGYWRCRHVIVCTRCGKRIEWSVPRDDCPDYQAAQKAR
jgi:hypothetical protein